MKRFLALTGAFTGLVLALPAAASATIIELGATKTALVAPTCPPNVSPANCTIILTRATALETIRDGKDYPTTASKAGYVVAFSVGLSALSSNHTTRLNDIKFLDHQYGGTTQLAITVLAPVGAKRLHQWKVTAQSPIFHVQPYLGEVVQFPLTSALRIKHGYVVALSTPTWAPVLSIDQTKSKFAYRQSRKTNCANPPGSSQAQMTIGESARYTCDYPGTRVEYSATEVVSPTYPKGYVRTTRR